LPGKCTECRFTKCFHANNNTGQLYSYAFNRINIGVAWNLFKSPLRPFPSLTLPFPTRPPKSGEHSKLRQRGPGWSPGRRRILGSEITSHCNIFSRLCTIQMTAKCVLEVGDTVKDKSDSICCPSVSPLATATTIRTESAYNFAEFRLDKSRSDHVDANVL